MSNDLVTRELQSALREEVEELGGGGLGQLLKFDPMVTPPVFKIVGGAEVPLGTRHIAHATQYARGPVRFIDGKPDTSHVKKLAQGKPPQCDDMDDPEEWVFQRYLLFENVETGVLLTFVSKSVGGKIALSNLLEAFEASKGARGLPVVELQIGDFNTADYGRKPRPDFKIVGWAGTGNSGSNGHAGPPLRLLNNEPPPNDDEPGNWEPDFR
jgi:hypothetical protein